jgi:hypothetical protein
MVLTVSFVIFPVIGFVVTVAGEITSADLMPASRHQNHTTSPSASARFVKRAFASIASRPAFTDDRERPSGGTRRGELWI